MELTEYQIFLKKYAKQNTHCTQNTLIPYECEQTSFSCGLNVTRSKNEVTKMQRNKLGFIIRLNFSGKGVTCVCIHIVELNEVDHFDEFFKVLKKL